MGRVFKTPCARPARGPQDAGRIGPKEGFPHPFFVPSPCATRAQGQVDAIRGPRRAYNPWVPEGPRGIRYQGASHPLGKSSDSILVEIDQVTLAGCVGPGKSYKLKSKCRWFCLCVWVPRDSQPGGLNLSDSSLPTSPGSCFVFGSVGRVSTGTPVHGPRDRSAQEEPELPGL
jgi:hypothetical protein